MLFIPGNCFPTLFVPARAKLTLDDMTADSNLENASSTSTPSIEEGNVSTGGHVLTHDEYHLATLGYNQEFFRSLGFFESWAATFTSMNFVSGIPAAFANWTMIGGLSCCVSLVLAEIAAAFPTAGGIYYWSYRLGGEEWGPFLSWMTAWWNW
jgi:hypothetical protein